MPEADIPNNLASTSCCKQLLQIPREDFRRDDYRVDVGEERFGLVQRDNLGVILSSKVSQRIRVTLDISNILS